MASIKASGGQAIAVAGDIMKPEYTDLLIKKAAEFGNGKIHIIGESLSVGTHREPRLSG